jgi:hydroxyethylthiazole kinase-like uncharacterized protein yjeF
MFEQIIGTVSLPLFGSQDIRKIEQMAMAGDPSLNLMEKAGQAAADFIASLPGNHRQILALAGPGNNGGDAFVAARHLAARGFHVTVVCPAGLDKLPPDAAAACRAWLGHGGKALPCIPPEGAWNLVVDGLFGIGLARDLSAPYLGLVKQVNQMRVPVLSLDIPSGLDSETGQPFGAAIRADYTLTFIGLKPGLFTAYSRDYCGQLYLDTLDLPHHLYAPTDGRLIGQSEVATLLRTRPWNSHKGMLGSVGISGGANSTIGAALMAGRAAHMLGAGRVFVGLLADSPPAVDFSQPELMLRPPEQLLESGLDCLIIGPGLGQSAKALDALQQALDSELKLVIDADAINLIASDDKLQAQLKARKAASILTPHPTEAGRLLGISNHEIQQDRIGSALVLAKRLNSLLVLKGAGTVIAWPDGRWAINPTGNPGLSSAGMGDILCGMIAALIAQRLGPDKAALLAIYLHGLAADDLARQGIGPIGLTTGEVLSAARKILNQWVNARTAISQP